MVFGGGEGSGFALTIFSKGIWLVGLLPDWSPLLPYMADGTGHYAERVGDTQHFMTSGLTI